MVENFFSKIKSTQVTNLLKKYSVTSFYLDIWGIFLGSCFSKDLRATTIFLSNQVAKVLTLKMIKKLSNVLSNLLR